MQRTGPRVLLLAGAAALLGLGAASAAGVVLAGPPVDPLALLLLTGMFVLAEVRVVHVSVGRQTLTQSLGEIPLVLGLVLAAPVDLALAMCLGPLAVHLLHRRPPAVKVVFNLLSSLAQVGTALALSAVVLAGPAASASALRLWVAALLATTCSLVLSHLLVVAAVAVSERSRGAWQRSRVDLPPALLTSAVVTVLALVALHALRDDARSAVLLVVVGAVVLRGFRGYAELVERHSALERLHAFSRTVSLNRHPDEVLRSVLEQARELLQAEYAAVHLRSAEGGLVLSLGRDGVLRRSPGSLGDDREGVLARVLSTRRPLLLRRDTTDPVHRAHLRRVGRSELVLTPLPGSSELIGVLVAGDRVGGAVRTFQRDDVRLLETVAHHAAVALRSGHLLERLEHDAAHDALTGLANRWALLERSSAALAADSRSPVALLLLDLDGFKQVNDGLGHAAGDALLRSTAERLRSVLPEQALAARLGADEFAVLLPAVADEQEALDTARRVRAALSAPMTVHGVTVAVGASAGLAVCTAGQDAPEVLLQNADLALTEARAEGDPDVRVFTAAPGLAGAERMALVADLRGALDRGELEVHVQPKADLGDGRVVGVEALVRWTHPELGPVFPDVFIPLAERSGLIVPLTSLVLDRAVRAAASWYRAGESLHVAVNLSPRSLQDDAIVDEVLAVLFEHGLPPGLLTLEITEGCVIADPERAERVLWRLRGAGVRLSLDDFGTGYSSLTHLKRLPVHEVKIDRSFVRHLAEDDDDAAIVRSIVDLGLNLRLAVVAEGVEDDRAWALLAELGCDLAQGYHLSRPLPAADFPAWLEAHRQSRRRVLPDPRAAADSEVTA